MNDNKFNIKQLIITTIITAVISGGIGAFFATDKPWLLKGINFQDNFNPDLLTLDLTNPNTWGNSFPKIFNTIPNTSVLKGNVTNLQDFQYLHDFLIFNENKIVYLDIQIPQKISFFDITTYGDNTNSANEGKFQNLVRCADTICQTPTYSVKNPNKIKNFQFYCLEHKNQINNGSVTEIITSYSDNKKKIDDYIYYCRIKGYFAINYYAFAGVIFEKIHLIAVPTYGNGISPWLHFNQKNYLNLKEKE